MVASLPVVSCPTVAQRRLIPSALKLLSDETPCAFLYDMDFFRGVLTSIQSAFPPSAVHAIAMKANPLAACLSIARDLGMGCEVASPAELEHALRLGFTPSKIIFDSPAKTCRDLRRSLRAGVKLNADNLEELERIDAILVAEFGGGGARGSGTCTSTLGVRVNPQYGEGKISATGTIARTSKFGVPLLETREQLLACYAKYAWLTAVHCHVGSQGCEVDLLVRGAKSVLDLAREINANIGEKRVRVLDIGGGMPVDYESDLPDDERPTRVTPSRFAAALAEAVPELFDETQWQLLTEFGRYASAKSGVLLSRVEYVKSAGGRRIATIHAGADCFLRTAYHPENWPHRVSAWSAAGAFLPPSTDVSDDVWDVVGPLCFRGDIVAHEVALPRALASGCAIAVHDVGAYTLAMFSKYNSRTAPPVYGHHGGGAIVALADGETVDDALAMWQLAGSRRKGRVVGAGVMGGAATLTLAAAVGALLAVAVMRT